MAHDDFAPERALAQALQRQLQQAALALGAPAAAAAAAGRVARALSLATADGHVCQWLDDLAGQLGQVPAALRQALLDSGLVTSADHDAVAPLPLVLDSSGRLYLHRAFDHEQALARRLRRALDPGAAGSPAVNGDDEQQAAVERALQQRLTVISGGPGTGKTSLVVQLLARVLQADPGARVALAAPTGKAAARMAESIAERVRSLPADLPEAVRTRLPRVALTVHRLLGHRPDAGPGERWRHHAGLPLAIDWLVVDEASMLDLALARRLLDAVPDSAHVVLLGDAHQLAAVEAGAVFAELAAWPPPGPVIALRHSHRFGADSAIGRLARAVNTGDVDTTLALLQATADPALRWTPTAAPAAAAVAAEAAFAPYRQRLGGGATPSEAQAAFQRARVLTATHGGPNGQERLNHHLDIWARRTLDPGAPATSPWYHGRPVLVLRNQPALGLYNGDVGLALRNAEGVLEVHIAGRERPLAPSRLGAHQSAWAMTVHKAQGSEFDDVLLALPPATSPMLTRELLYTAVTRARQRVQLLGTADALRVAVATPTRRASGLLERVASAGARQAPAS